MTTRPYELLVRFNQAGNVVGVSVRSITTVNGRDYEGDPEPLSGASDPAFTQFAEQFAAAIVAERDQLASDKAGLIAERDSLIDERDGLAADKEILTGDKSALIDQIAELDQEREELRTELTAVADGLREEKALLLAENNSLRSQVEPLQAERDSLRAQLGAILNPPGPDLSTAAGVKQFASNERYKKETGGIVVGGQLISTERDEIGHWFPRFYNALMWLQGDARTIAGNPEGKYPYKPKGGSPVTLTAGQVLRAYECMAWFINACFASEEAIYKSVDSGLRLDVVIESIPAAWPSNSFEWEPPQ